MISRLLFWCLMGELVCIVWLCIGVFGGDVPAWRLAPAVTIAVSVSIMWRNSRR